ncbi:MAG: SGNH/GDSL hydrolase family protein [Fimbriimonadales bacterium]|nr:SGNH/GDSL hydrolase family protein [Fimbriimonadales bacterium]
MKLQNGQTVLFQGDSITDCGRDRNDPASLGFGYAMMVGAWVGASHPDLGIRFLNRGISGDRVKDLEARWERDAIELRPDWLSILIGINDVWRRYDANDPTTVDAFQATYRRILQRAADANIQNLVLLEPFVLPFPEDRCAWREDLDPKIDAVRCLAREFGAIYVPLDGLFASAAARREPSFWAPDGVHPSAAGHALIAQAWLRAVGAL